MDDQIQPALQLDQEATGEMSAEAFQKQLYQWYEEKNILGELRAHLRLQMIKILKGTNILPFARRKISPKTQTIVLLVSEFLFCENYQYSLCVFNTEAPTVREFPFITPEMDAKSFRFTIEEVNDILEAFGLKRNSKECKNISDYYYSNSENSLLSCVIHMLSNVALKRDSRAYESILRMNYNVDNINELFESVVDCKSLSDKVSTTVRNMLEIEKEKNNVKMKGICDKLERDCEAKVEKYKRKVTDMEKVFETERKKLEEELLLTKISLKECAETLQLRIGYIEQQEKIIIRKEKELKRREEKLTKNRKKHVEKAANETKTPVKIQVAETQKIVIKDENIDRYSNQNHKEIKNVSKVDNKKQGTTVKEIDENGSRSENNINLTPKKHEIKKVCILDNSKQEINKTVKETHEYSSTVDKNQNQSTNSISKQCKCTCVIACRNNDKIIKPDKLVETDTNYVQISSKNFSRINDEKLVELKNLVHNLQLENRSLQETNQEQKVQLKRLANNAQILVTKLRKNTVPYKAPNVQKSFSSSSSEFSPTENILIEARKRLKILEKESSLIERNFQKYRHSKHECENNAMNYSQEECKASTCLSSDFCVLNASMSTIDLSSDNK